MGKLQIRLKMCAATFRRAWSLVAIILWCGAPSPVAAAELKFFLEVESNSQAWCISCSGPWSRGSDFSLVRPGENRNFYSADENLFSPFGAWNCEIGDPQDGNCSELAFPTLAFVEFCLFDDPGDEGPQLTASGTSDDARLTVDEPSSCSSTATVSVLGDQTKSAFGRWSRRHGNDRDRDSYFTQAAAEEELVIRLTGDGEVGHQGDQVILYLIQEHGSFKRRVKGTLPIEIVQTIPQDGLYRIVVEPDGQIGKSEVIGSEDSGPFRGGYILSLNNSSSAPELIPSSDVEP